MSEENNKTDNGKIFIIFLVGLIIALSVVFAFNQIKMSYIVNEVINTNITNIALDENNRTEVVPYNKEKPLLILTASQVICNTTFASNFTYNTYTFNVTNGTCLAPDQLLGIFSPFFTRFGTHRVLSVTGDEVEVTFPPQHNYQPGDFIFATTDNMNVDGSVTPQIFSLKAGVNFPVNMVVTRIIVHILDQTAMDDSKFGGLPSLDRGVLIRRVDGSIDNLVYFRNNGELSQLCYDIRYDEKAPAGFYSLTGRLTFGGLNKMGTAVFLGNNEDLEVLIQDDLTGLDQFKITFEGYIDI
jgi:hypothetical protein